MSAVFQYKSKHLSAVLMLVRKPFKGTAHTLSDQQIKLGIAPAPAKTTDSGFVKAAIVFVSARVRFRAISGDSSSLKLIRKGPSM